MHAIIATKEGMQATIMLVYLQVHDNRQRTGSLDIVAKGLVDGATMYQVEFFVFAPTLSTPS